MPGKYEWDKLTRASKLASIMFPHLAPTNIQREMQRISAGEGKKAPAPSPLLSDQTRGATSPLDGRAKR
jgi:hypothetical protein